MSTQRASAASVLPSRFTSALGFDADRQPDTSAVRFNAKRSTQVAGIINDKLYLATGNSPTASSSGWVGTFG